jgi:branched-chain amino acid transport system permease protein
MPTRRSAATSAVALIALLLWVPSPDRLLATRAFTWALLALSAWFLLRVGGRSSLGNAAFYGVASYTVGVAVTQWNIDSFWIVLGLAVVFSAASGLVVGLVSGRLSGFHFLLVTLAFAEMLRSLATQWKRLGGEDGMPGISRPSTWPLRIDLTDSTTMMWFTAFWLVVVIIGLVAVLRSPFGAAVLAVRDSESRMAALGYYPTVYRVTAVVVSSVVAGVAGTLNAYAIRFVSPTDMVPLVSAKALLFSVVGGAGLIGAAVAATALTFLEDELSSRFDRWLTVLGAVYIMIAALGDHPARTLVGRFRSGGKVAKAADTDHASDESAAAPTPPTASVEP